MCSCRSPTQCRDGGVEPAPCRTGESLAGTTTSPAVDRRAGGDAGRDPVRRWAPRRPRGRRRPRPPGTSPDDDPVVAFRPGQAPAGVAAGGPWELHTEDGAVLPVDSDDDLPPDLPLGYHWLRPRRRRGRPAAADRVARPLPPPARPAHVGLGGAALRHPLPGVVGDGRPGRPPPPGRLVPAASAPACACSTRCTPPSPTTPRPARTTRRAAASGTRCTSGSRTSPALGGLTTPGTSTSPPWPPRAGPSTPTGASTGRPVWKLKGTALEHLWTRFPERRRRHCFRRLLRRTGGRPRRLRHPLRPDRTVPRRLDRLAGGVPPARLAGRGPLRRRARRPGRLPLLAAVADRVAAGRGRRRARPDAGPGRRGRPRRRRRLAVAGHDGARHARRRPARRLQPQGPGLEPPAVRPLAPPPRRLRPLDPYRAGRPAGGRRPPGRSRDGPLPAVLDPARRQPGRRGLRPLPLRGDARHPGPGEPPGRGLHRGGGPRHGGGLRPPRARRAGRPVLPAAVVRAPPPARLPASRRWPR